MEQTMISQILKMQSNLFHIPFYLYKKGIRLEAFEPLPCSCDLVAPWLNFLSDSSESLSIHLTPHMLLLGKVEDNSSGFTIIIGPVRIVQLKENTLHSILLEARPHLKVENLDEVSYFLNSNALFTPEKIAPLLCSLHGFLNQQIVSEADLLKYGMTEQIVKDANTQMMFENQKHAYDEEPRRNNFNMESEMMFYINHGMTKHLKDMNLGYEDIGILAFDSLRHYKNALIILNSLSQRAAITGGLDPEVSYQLGEIYIQKIEACQDIEALMYLSDRLRMDYCERVAQIIHPITKHKNINDALHYIRENYQKKLSVEEIASAVGLTKEYLSSKFHKVTGMPLPHYINQLKIMEAKQLLHFTDMSLSEIAQYLSFSSQSYFQTVFKKQTGDTPSEYRLKNKQELLKNATN